MQWCVYVLMILLDILGELWFHLCFYDHECDGGGGGDIAVGKHKAYMFFPLCLSTFTTMLACMHDMPQRNLVKVKVT